MDVVSYKATDLPPQNCGMSRPLLAQPRLLARAPSYPIHSAATAIGTHKAADFVAFAHATIFSPALSTLL